MGNCIYIFLDEGGNFDFSPKGTRYFVLTSVTASRPFMHSELLDGYKHDCLEFGLDTEYFHCAEDNNRVKNDVFKLIAEQLDTIEIDSLIIEKAKTGPALRRDSAFYPKMLGYLLRYVVSRRMFVGNDEVIVITDSIPVASKRKAIEKAVKNVLSEMLPAGMKYRILHHASRSHYVLQVADYCNWAIFRKWQKSDTTFYELIKPSIKSEFEIFRNGTTFYY